jgi:hypothetical protein
LDEDKGDQNSASFLTAPKPPTEKAGRVFCTFGLILSCRWLDQEPIIEAITKLGGQVVCRIPTTGHLFVLRTYEVEQVLKGDLSALQALYDRKMRKEKGDEVRRNEHRNRTADAETSGDRPGKPSDR